jgi:hypothetical protein
MSDNENVDAVLTRERIALSILRQNLWPNDVLEQLRPAPPEMLRDLAELAEAALDGTPHQFLDECVSRHDQSEGYNDV